MCNAAIEVPGSSPLSVIAVGVMEGTTSCFRSPAYWIIAEDGTEDTSKSNAAAFESDAGGPGAGAGGGAWEMVDVLGTDVAESGRRPSGAAS